MKVIILMAGRGSRFRKYADLPKPFISVHGKPMVYYATISLPFIEHTDRPAKTKEKITAKDLIFIALEEHLDQIDLNKELTKWYGKGFKLIILPKLTRGNLETAYIAKKFVKPTEKLLILDADNFYNGQPMYDAIFNGSDFEGMFPVFRPRDQEPKWCFVLHKKDGEILEISEKDPALMNKGASAMVGAFYYAKAKIFFNLAKKMIKEEDLSGPEGKKEFYMAKTYNRLLGQNKKIKAVMIKEMWGLGTPEDLEYFLGHYLRGK